MQKRRAQIVVLFFIVCFLSPLRAFADWVNLSGAENAPNIAEIHVGDDHVRLELEVFVQDLRTFEDLIPEAFFENIKVKRPPPADRLRHFSAHGFQIMSEGGRILQAELKLAEPRFRKTRFSPYAGQFNPLTRQPIPGPPDDKRVLFVVLVYPFGKKPQTLTFIPPLDKETGVSKASIGFITYHKGVLINDFRYLSGPATLTLDWRDPWYSEFDKMALKRTIGSGMRTFLYIEPFEVRNEILVRVKDLMTWLDFGLRGDAYIEEDEFNRVREQVGRFFLDRENVTIDGQRFKPILDRTAFVESSLQRSRFIETPEKVPLNSAMVGVIITYLTDGIPREVTTTWELFSERVRKVTAVMTDPAGPFPYELTPEDNILKWTNYLKNYTIPTVRKIQVADRHRGVPVPLGSVVCIALLFPAGLLVLRHRRQGGSVNPLFGLIGLLAVGALVLSPFFQVSWGDSARAGRISPEEGRAILDSLLKNVYRAFDFRAEEDVYNRLALCVSGDRLADLYLQQRASLVVEQAGGAQAKVEDVTVEKVMISPSKSHKGALDLRSNWTATGKVGHWGHIHQRKNRYDALVTIQPVAGAWKIIALESLDEKRLF